MHALAACGTRWAFLVPATIFGLGIGPAVLVHEGSTVLVVFNALRLLAYSEPL